MAHFHVFGDRPALYQWDVNRRVVVNCDCQEVHFSNSLDGEALVVETYTEDGTRYANIPNILLQSALPLNVYAYVCGGERYTQRAALLEVNPRSKPADYVYTETEVKNYEALEARIKKLEENAGGGTVKSVNGKTPDENGNVEISTLTDESALALVVETGLVDPVTDENGKIFTDKNGKIFVL